MTPNDAQPRDHAGPGRPRAFDEREALAAALDLFWRQGYEATSLDDLTRAMGVSRSSFYGCFGSKHATLLAAVRSYADASFARLSEAARAEPSPREAVRAMVAGLAHGDGGCHGCLLVNCITELAGQDPEVQALVHRHMERVETLMARTIAEVEPEGADDRARALISLAIGAITLRKAGLPAERVDAALERAEPLLPRS